MNSTFQKLPDELAELKQLVANQRQVIKQNRQMLEQRDHQLKQHLKTISFKQTTIERLEAMLKSLQQQRFGRSSEQHPGQAELQFFNEAELLALEIVLAEPVAEPIAVKPHTRKPVRPRGLPDNLPRVEVIHDLSEAQKVCSCGQPLHLIGHEELEQLGVIPLQYFVIKHRK